MDKIQLTVLGLSASPASANAYALILKETGGNRRLPIIIGAFEAQAIALEMEGVTPPRPMTHDLLRSVIDNFGANLYEVYINELKDGTFYAKLIFDNPEMEIDARPSDAIALAVRMNAEIFVNSSIMDETGVMPQEGEQPLADAFEGGEDDELSALRKKSEETSEPEQKPKTTVERLQDLLDKAVKKEDYERAANLRDEIKRILESS